MISDLLIILLLVALYITYITDYVGFTGEMVDFAVGLMTKGKIKHVKPRKLIGCSLCKVTWLSLIISLIYLPFTFKYLLISIGLALAFGWSTQYILAIYDIIDGALTKVLGFIERITK